MDMFTARIDSHGKALELLSQRQKVLAGNIANADTPGFKARDFDFSAALAQARGEAGGAAVTSARHLRSTTVVQTSGGEPRLQWRQAEQPALDGNTVDLDRERAAFADNALRYEATLRFINGNVKTMLSAITGQ
jgi:flagellar basal-body rod protein FlgB